MAGSDPTREQEFDEKFVPAPLRAASVRGIGDPRERRLAEERRRAFLVNTFAPNAAPTVRPQPDENGASFSPSVNVRFKAKRPAGTNDLDTFIAGGGEPIDESQVDTVMENRRKAASDYNDVLGPYLGKDDQWKELGEGVSTAMRLYETGMMSMGQRAAGFKPMMQRENAYYRELQGLMQQSQDKRYPLINPATTGQLAVDAGAMALIPGVPELEAMNPLLKAGLNTAHAAGAGYGMSRAQGYTPDEAADVAKLAGGLHLGVAGALGGANKIANRVMFGNEDAIRLARQRAEQLKALGINVEPEYVNKMAAAATRYSTKYGILPTDFAANYEKMMQPGGDMEAALDKIRAMHPTDSMDNAVRAGADQTLPPSAKDPERQLQQIIERERASKKATAKNLFEEQWNLVTQASDPGAKQVGFHGKNYDVTTPPPAAVQTTEQQASKLLGPDGKPAMIDVTKTTQPGRVAPRFDFTEFDKELAKNPESFKTDPALLGYYEEMKAGKVSPQRMKIISQELERQIPDAGPGSRNDFLRQRLKVAVNNAADDMFKQLDQIGFKLAEGEKQPASGIKRLVNNKGATVASKTRNAVQRLYADEIAPVTQDVARATGETTGKALRQAEEGEVSGTTRRFAGKNVDALKKAGPEAVATVQRALFDDAMTASKDEMGRVSPGSMAKGIRKLVDANPGLYTDAQIASLNDMATALGNSADPTAVVGGVVAQPQTAAGHRIAAAGVSNEADRALIESKMTNPKGHVQPGKLLDPLERMAKSGRVQSTEDLPRWRQEGGVSLGEQVTRTKDAINHVLDVSNKIRGEESAVQRGKWWPGIAGAGLAAGASHAGEFGGAMTLLAAGAAAMESWPILRSAFKEYLTTLPSHPQTYQEQVRMFSNFMNGTKARALLATPTGMNVLADSMGMKLGEDRPLEEARQ